MPGVRKGQGEHLETFPRPSSSAFLCPRLRLPLDAPVPLSSVPTLPELACDREAPATGVRMRRPAEGAQLESLQSTHSTVETQCH